MILLHLIFLAFTSSTPAHAEVIINPETRHGQYTTYGLLFEPQSDLFVKSGGNAWASIGGYTSIVEFRDWKWSPQLVLHATANNSYRLDSGSSGVLTKYETIDARVGLAIDLKYSEDLRFSIIWTHDSGHISDNVPVENPSLIGPDVGDEYGEFRIIKDYGKTWRVGGSFKPAIKSHPTQYWFGANQFAEWFPKGPTDSHHFAPFIAAGLEEYGLDAPDLTGHIQLGLATGDHFAEHFEKAYRLVVGAYSGADPRLKFYKYHNEKSHFIYAGLMVDL
jgi:hypothetical protein